jgi:hypothetical protein
MRSRNIRQAEEFGFRAKSSALWTARCSATGNRAGRCEQFFEANQGRFGNFSFVDPWNGQTYPNCSFGNTDLALISLAEMKGRTTFVVKENRS